jgi:hypothetical protein
MSPPTSFRSNVLALFDFGIRRRFSPLAFSFRSNMATPTGLPEIHYPTRIDATHQGPKVTVTAALCLCIAGLVLATRMLIRWPWQRLLGLDDGAAIVASVRDPKTFNPTTERILTSIVAFCSGSMASHHQCCVAGARYGVRLGVRRSCSTGSEGLFIPTLGRLSLYTDEL